MDFIAKHLSKLSGRKTVRRVIAFNIGDPNLGFHEYLAWDEELFKGRAWESHVREYTGFDDVKLEIRLQQGFKKWRVVLFPGMELDVAFDKPPLAVVHARFIPNEGAAAMDVTRRVQKYIPGNGSIAVRDMFPFDDHEDNAERFTCLRIVGMNMRTYDLPLA